MLNVLQMPTYRELIGLSDSDLLKLIALSLSQVDKADEHHENTTLTGRIYQTYRNELAKRNYEQRKRIFVSPSTQKR